MEGTFHREEYWERVGPSSRAFNPQKMVTQYFHRNKPRKLYWKYFVSRHVSPASSNSCRDSIVVIVVLSARVPGQALLIELKGDFYHHFNLQEDSPWWQSEECECSPPSREQDLPHHFPSTAKHQHHRRLQWMSITTTTLMRNISSPEESVAPTILSGSRRRSNPRGLSSPRYWNCSPDIAISWPSQWLTNFLGLFVGGSVQCSRLALVVPRPPTAALESHISIKIHIPNQTNIKQQDLKAKQKLFHPHKPFPF